MVDIWLKDVEYCLTRFEIREGLLRFPMVPKYNKQEGHQSHFVRTQGHAGHLFQKKTMYRNYGGSSFLQTLHFF